MKLNALLIVTHTAVAALVGGAVALSFLVGSLWTFAGATVVAAICIVVASWVPAFRIRRGLRAMDKALAKRGGISGEASGIVEFDKATQRLCEYAQRWDEVTATGREHAKEVDSLLQILDRRNDRNRSGGSSSVQLRQLLSGIGGALQNNLTQITQCVDELGRCAQEIATSTDSQGNSLNKTNICVEQLSAKIDLVATRAQAAQEAFSGSRKLVDETGQNVRELLRGMERIRSHTESSEKKLRALGDHSQEISSIVDTIAEIAAKTDMLALNASIESVRAGEHGKGFAVVAEEVRSLAEQATQAAREVAGLVESMRLETQESISGISHEKAHVENEVSRAFATGEALERIGQLSEESVLQIQEIVSAAEQQARLVNDVVTVAQAIAAATKTSRKRSERACWMVNTLTKNARSFSSSLKPLHQCGDGYIEGVEEQLPPESFSEDAVDEPNAELNRDDASRGFADSESGNLVG